MSKLLDWWGPKTPEWYLARRLDLDRLPKHIAVIMDGNGRWASRRRLPRAAGHRAGVKAVRTIIRDCCRLGIDNLTLYAFSVENWKRPKGEVDTLWALMRNYLRRELPDLKTNGVRFQTIGRTEELPRDLRDDIEYASIETATNDRVRLNVAINYSGRTEIVDAVNDLLRRSYQRDQLVQVDERTLSEQLCTAGLPDPDLLIRTSGEFRISNFLLWQIAYSEIWVTERLWPDFQTADLLEAILDYQKRHRRYGGLPSAEAQAASSAREESPALVAVNE